MPQDWQLATITFEKGDCESLSTYCPASLLLVVCRGMKRLPKNEFDMSPSNYEALNGSSLSNLILLEDKVTSLVDDREALDLPYLDFTKAYNSVNNHFLHGLQRVSWPFHCPFRLVRRVSVDVFFRSDPFEAADLLLRKQRRGQHWFGLRVSHLRKKAPSCIICAYPFSPINSKFPCCQCIIGVACFILIVLLYYLKP